MNQYFGMQAVHSNSRMPKAILALSLGATALFGALAWKLLSPIEPRPERALAVDRMDIPEVVKVLVPVREIEAHTKLEPKHFRLELKPAYFAQNSYVTAKEDIANMFSRSLMIAGQPVHLQEITGKRPAQHIRDSIPAGFRAVTIRVNEKTGVAGWAWPGARVDVKWITRVNGRLGIIPIVQNAEVLSAERSTDSTRSKNAPVPTTVTLLVSARESSEIQLASESGTISLSLRGLSDPGQADDVAKITLRDLLRGIGGEQEAEDRYEGEITVAGERFKIKRGGQLVPVKGDRALL